MGRGQKVSHDERIFLNRAILTFEGEILMEYEIIEKPAFTFAGVSKRVPLQFEGVNNAILKLAQSITQEQKEEMKRLQNMRQSLRYP